MEFWGCHLPDMVRSEQRAPCTWWRWHREVASWGQLGLVPSQPPRGAASVPSPLSAMGLGQLGAIQLSQHAAGQGRHLETEGEKLCREVLRHEIVKD